MRLFLVLSILITPNVFGQGKVFPKTDTLHYSIEYSKEGYSRIDTIQLQITDNNWRKDNTQNECIYVYNTSRIDSTEFPGLNSIGWVSTDTTGFLDNITKFWIHPPRHNHLMIMEISPFPRIHYPLEVGNKYSLMLVIGEGWGDLSFSQIRWNYEVTKEVDGAWTIEASAIPQNKPSDINELTFTFSLNRGFINLDYSFNNGVKIIMSQLSQ